MYLYDTCRELVAFVDDEILDYLIKENSSDINRLRCFIGDTYSDTIYKVNDYGNLENVEQDDFSYVIDEMIELLESEN